MVLAGPAPAGDWRREFQSPILPFANSCHLATMQYHNLRVLLYIYYNIDFFELRSLSLKCRLTQIKHIPLCICLYTILVNTLCVVDDYMSKDLKHIP